MPLLSLLSANFIFYITFVQFGLLKMISGRFDLSIDSLGLPLGLMALSGIYSSIATGLSLDRRQRPLNQVFRRACTFSVLEGFAAIASIMVFDQGLLIPLFVLLGLLMGSNGVLIIRVVETWPPEKRGIMAGYAMALVYLSANLMAGFISMPERIALINGILVVITGSICLSLKDWIDTRPGFQKGAQQCAPIPHSSLTLQWAVIILAALVAVDSFVFYLETNREDIYRYTWEGRWPWNGIVHAISAVAAGIIWDRKGDRPVFAASLSSFALSLFFLATLPIGLFTGLVSTILYNTAVSFYGIMMLVVWFSVASDMGLGLRIGVGMAFAGWIASPLGIALAMKALSLSASVAFLGPLIIIVFLFLINARIADLPQTQRHGVTPPRSPS
jgi:MFS family permease